MTAQEKNVWPLAQISEDVYMMAVVEPVFILDVYNHTKHTIISGMSQNAGIA